MPLKWYTYTNSNGNYRQYLVVVFKYITVVGIHFLDL